MASIVSSVASPAPPVAARRPHLVALGAVADGPARGSDGDALITPPVEVDDDLFWLRDDARAAPDVLAHLRAESEYFVAATAPLAGGAEALARELRARLKEADAEAPWRVGNFTHYLRTEEGASYPIHCRRRRVADPAAGAGAGAGAGAAEGGEEIVLDENAVADGHEQCDVHHMAFSPSQDLLAFTVDFSGAEEYAVRLVRLGGRADGTGADYASSAAAATAAAAAASSAAASADELTGVYGAVEFGADNRHIFYLTLDDAHRPFRLWRHALGSAQASDVCLLQEDDDRMWLWLRKSASGDFLFVRAVSKLSSEVVAVPLTERAMTGARLAGARPFTALDVASGGEAAAEGSAAVAVATSEGKRSRVEPPAADGAALPLRLVVRQREANVLYSADHFRGSAPDGSEDAFVIRANVGGAKNFKVAVAAVAAPAAWVDVLAASEDRYLTDVEVRRNFWAIAGREDGFATVWVVDPANAAAAARAATAPGSPAVALELQRVPPRDAVFVTEISARNVDYDAEACRFTYESPTTPTLTCECRPRGAAAAGPLTWPATVPDAAAAAGVAGAAAGSIVVLKAQEIPNIDLSAYSTALLFALAADGRRIPISLVYRPSAHALRGGSAAGGAGGGAAAGGGGDGGGGAAAAAAGACAFAEPAPLHLYAYGAYGLCEEPIFSAADLSLCDRGVVHAIAHVRGGSERGRAWYEDEGKLLKKKNTFSDYLACADFLVAQGWTRRGLVAAEGGSAGGLLMGVVANERPELFACVLAQVPFLDAVVTMCDASIPLVSTEWEEWGNPNTQEALAYMLSYDPMRNVRPQAYPPMFLSAGLTDSRVGYWEPAKFVQRVRAANTGAHRVIFKCELDEGHTGAQDRFRGLRDRALELAWMLDGLGIRV